MTLKQAIRRCQERAQEPADGEFFLQLAEWLTELHGWRQFFNASGKVYWAPVDDRTKTRMMEGK